MATNWNEVLVKLDENRYMIPRSYKQGMLTDAIVYADKEMIGSVMKDQSLCGPRGIEAPPP